MKIKKIILNNFRKYKNQVIEVNSNLHVIVGRNDVGKSSIFEALDIFFEGGSIKIDVDDCNVHSADRKITIGVIFEVDGKKEIVLDDSTKTNLHDEYLLNKDGDLEIHKTWDCSGKTITAKGSTTHINAFYFSCFKDNPLICRKNAELKKELKERDLTSKNYVSNPPMREAIYESIQDSDRENMSIQIDKEDTKKIWEVLKKDLPMFFLFQSDRENKDSDKEIQSPLKAITKTAVASMQNELDQVKAQVESNIKEIAKQTLDKLREMAPDVAKKLSPDIDNKAWDSLFSFSFKGDDDIPINKRGSGIRRLIMLNYFRAEAERKSAAGKGVIYAIEEPETSQHPNHQILLVKALQELSEKSENQILITTHTPEIAKFFGQDALIHITVDDNGDVIIDDSNDKLENIAVTLGVLPYLCKFSIFVEGTNDVKFIGNIGKNIPELKGIFDFEQHEDVQLLPIYGGNLANWIAKGYIEKSNIKAFYLLDNDNTQNTTLANDINNKNGESCALLTKFLMMENYCNPSLIEQEFNVQFNDEEKNDWGTRNVIQLILEKTGKSDKASVKNIINKDLSQLITRQSLEEIGAWEEVEEWFKKIKKMHGEG